MSSSESYNEHLGSSEKSYGDGLNGGFVGAGKSMSCSLQQARGARLESGLHRINSGRNLSLEEKPLPKVVPCPVKKGCDMQYNMQVFCKDQSVPNSEGSTVHVRGKNVGKRCERVANRSANEWAEAYHHWPP